MTAGISTVTAAQDTLWVGEKYTAFAAVRANNSHLTVNYINVRGIVVYDHTIVRHVPSGNYSNYKNTMVEYNTVALGYANHARMSLFWIIFLFVVIAYVRHTHPDDNGSTIGSANAIPSCNWFRGMALPNSPLYRRRFMRRI